MRGTRRKRKVALAGGGRGPNEEANLTLEGNDDGLGLGSGSSQLHDDDDSRRGRNRDHRVHQDAKLAVIRVGIVRVKVRDLSDSQRRQQDQTEHRHGRQKARRHAPLGAAFAAEDCLKSCQSMEPSGPILQKESIDLDALVRAGLYLSYDLAATPGENAGGPRASKLSCHGLLCTSSARAGAFAGYSPRGASGYCRAGRPAERNDQDGTEPAERSKFEAAAPEARGSRHGEKSAADPEGRLLPTGA